MLQDKRAPTPLMLAAGAQALVIAGTIVYILATLSTYIEEHFHIFHPNQAAVAEAGKRPSAVMLVPMLALFPLLSMLGMILCIPLLILPALQVGAATIW